MRVRDHPLYECVTCGCTVTSHEGCVVCGDSAQLSAKFDMPPEGSVRVVCHDCDFKTTIEGNEVEYPTKLAVGRSHLHESDSTHQTTVLISYGENTQLVTPGEKQRVCGELSDEYELQSWLESYFEDCGWTAIREVSPHRSDFKADLIVEHEDYGWIGIEAKYFDSDGGAKIADAHHQITRKYRGEKYLNNRIDLWAICPYFSSRYFDGYHINQNTFRAQTTREFFCRHGIGYINLVGDDLLIDFAYSRGHAKIPVNDESDSRHHDNVDIESIRSTVQKKMERFDYK
jgi:hypothetical protein